MVTRYQVGVLTLTGAVLGCHTDLAILPANQIPVADARVLRNGESFNARIDGGAAELKFDFAGSPVMVTLDGTHSYDPDGTIVAYQWLSATLASSDGGAPQPSDGGTMLRFIPDGAPPNWPGTSSQPQVELGQGIWSFSLWVIDNQGAISQPDTIKITVGAVVDPAVKQCADKVLSTEPAACSQCLCSQSDMCRAAVTADKCDQTCWNLVNCTAANCPNFPAMAAMGDYSCLTANCAAYTGGSTGATPVAPCFNACQTECKGVPVSGGDGGGGGNDSGGSPAGDAGGGSANDGASVGG
jgi:hypothetical protein